MRIIHIAIPPGVSRAAERKMVRDVTTAITEGYYHVGLTIIMFEQDSFAEPWQSDRVLDRVAMRELKTTARADIP